MRFIKKNGHIIPIQDKRQGERRADPRGAGRRAEDRVSVDVMAKSLPQKGADAIKAASRKIKEQFAKIHPSYKHGVLSFGVALPTHGIHGAVAHGYGSYRIRRDKK